MKVTRRRPAAPSEYRTARQETEQDRKHRRARAEALVALSPDQLLMVAMLANGTQADAQATIALASHTLRTLLTRHKLLYPTVGGDAVIFTDQFKPFADDALSLVLKTVELPAVGAAQSGLRSALNADDARARGQW